MKKLILLLVLSWADLAHAETLTLDKVVAAVLQTHPNIAAAKWDTKAAKHAKHAGAWLEDPSVGVMYEEVPLNSASLGNAGMTDYTVSQEVPFPAVLTTKSKALEARYQAKKAMLTETERAQIFEAKKTYFAIVATTKQIASQQAALNYYSQLLKSLEATYQTRGTTAKSIANVKDGMGTTSIPVDAGMGGGSGLADVFMARMKKAELNTQIHDLHHQHDSLKAKLNLMMGRDPDTKTDLAMPSIPTLRLDLKTLEAKVLSQNTNLQALDWMVKEAKRESSLAKLSLIPKLTPEFSYNQRQNQDNAYTLGLSLNLPLWLNKNSALIGEAKANHFKAQSQLEAQKLSAKSDLYYLWNHAKWHAQILRQYKGEILPLAKAAVSTDLAAYELGQGAATSSLQKLINYHAANSEYWRMWQDYQTEYALLEQLVGENL